MRVFVAVEMSGHAVAALDEVVERLSSLQLRGVRVVPAKNIHLTLKFLGDVDRERTVAVSKTLSRVATRHSGSTLDLGEAGAFPNDTRPRVLWVGLAGDTGPLLRLQQEIDESLAALGFEEERRCFMPHLTVARMRDGTRLDDRKRAVEAWAETPIGRGISVPIWSVSVMRSILSSAGARYQRLASFDLLQTPARHWHKPLG